MNKRVSSASKTAKLTRLARLAFPTFFVAILVVGAAAIIKAPLHHDSAWYFHVASELLEGARPYVDVIEVNPPLVLSLHLVTFFSADRLNVPVLFLFRVAVLLLALASVLVSYRVLRLLLPAHDNLSGGWVILQLFLFVPFAGWEYGQREHLMVILVCPFLLTAALRMARKELESTALAWSIGIAAGIGFLLKPYFLPVWIMLEVVLLRRHGAAALKRPETLAVMGTGVAYFLSVLAFTPGYLRVATWAAETYGHFYPGSPREYLIQGTGIIAALGLALLFLRSRDGGIRSLQWILAWSTTMLIVGVWVQGKGWDYHWLPVWMVFALFAGATLMGQVARHGTAAQAVVLLAGSGVLFTFTASAVPRAENEWSRFDAEYSSLVRSLAFDRTVYALAATMQPAFPLVYYADLQWTSRFACLWMLPGLYAHVDGSPVTGDRFPYRDLDEQPALEKYLFSAVIEDLERNRPSLVIVDRFPPSPGLGGFDYLEYFSRAEAFEEAFGNYVYAGERGRYLFFQRTR